MIIGLHERSYSGVRSSDAANLDDVVAGCSGSAKPNKVTVGNGGHGEGGLCCDKHGAFLVAGVRRSYSHRSWV